MKDKILKAFCFIAAISIMCSPVLNAQTEDINKKSAEKAALEKELERTKKLNTQLEEKSKDFYVKKQDFDAMKKNLASLTKLTESMNKERMALKEENQKWASERAKLYEELGTAYTKAGLFDEAIDAYSKSLVYGPNNADVHYYLGLLYQKSMKNPEKAVFHFKKYLYLKPDAKNKDDVRYLIDMVLNKR